MKKTLILPFLLILILLSPVYTQSPVLHFKLKQKNQFFKSTTLYNTLAKDPKINGIRELEFPGILLNTTIGQISCRDSVTLTKTIDLMNAHPDVDWAERNTRLKVYQETLPNDTLLNRQWYWFTVGADYLHVNNIFNYSQRKIPVAVIDTGVDFNHPDLLNRLWINLAEDINHNLRLDDEDLNGLDEDGNGFVDDVIGYDFTDAPGIPAAGDYLQEDPVPMDDYGTTGHGTPVAGLIAAQSDNITGIAGISPVTELMVLRAGSSSGYLEVDDVVKSIFYAVNNGAAIINMSFGDIYASRLLQLSIQYAFEHNVVMVAAAGNSASTTPTYPAAWPEVLGIASLNSLNNRSGFSNYGNWISFSLPGESVLTTAINEKYTLVNGTSFACPVSAAVISVPLSIELSDNEINVAAFYSRLENHSTFLGNGGFNADFGYGLLKFPAVLQEEQLEITVQSPEPYAVVPPETLPLVTTVWGNNIERYSFSINLDNTLLWDSASFRDFIYQDTLTIIDISSFPKDTMLTLITEVETYNSEKYQRITPFFISDQLPQLEAFSQILWWEGNSPRDFIKIRTNRDCSASITTFDPENTPLITRFSEGSGTEHYFDIHENGYPAIKFNLFNTVGHTGPVPDSTVLLNSDETTLPEIPSRETLQFPNAAFINGQMTDLNQNGFPEIIYSRSSADTVFGILTIAELFQADDALQYQIKGESVQSFIPRSVGDVNGDGKPEILAGYGARAYLLSDTDNDQLPLEIIWQDTLNNWAVKLKDFENDGIFEGILRKNNQYQIWQWDMEFHPNIISVFELPESYSPLYSVPNIIFTDLEGDSQQEAIFGDFTGNLYIFRQEENTSYRFFQTIETGYQGITDYMISSDYDENGKDELYFLNAVMPGFDSDYLMNYSYWQVNRLSLVNNQVTLDNIANFKGVQISNHFFKGLQKYGEYLIANLSPLQYWINMTGQPQPQFFESHVNINKVLSGRILEDSILVTGLENKLAIKKLLEESQRNFLSNTGFCQKNDSTLHISWEWQVAENDSIRISVLKDTILIYDRNFTGSQQTDIIIPQDTSNYICEFMTIRNGRINQNIRKQLTSHNKPQITATILTSSPLLVKLDCTGELNSKKIRAENFRFHQQQMEPTQINFLNNDRSVLLLFENIYLNRDTLLCRNIADQLGYIFDDIIPIDIPLEIPGTFYPASALMKDRQNIYLSFNKEVQDYSINDSGYFQISPSTKIRQIQKNSSAANQLIITVDKNNNLAGYGSRGSISIQHLKSMDDILLARGNRITLPLMNTVTSLEKTIVFPNPFKIADHEELIIGNIPLKSQIKIISITGELLFQKREVTGSGSCKINIIKELPELVSGVYIIVISSEGKSKIKKWFYIK